MANLKIDYDRGVLFSVHHTTGMNIYMYPDDPGVYLNAYGAVVGETLAKEAGFEVERWGKAKLKKERMAVAMNAIETELASQEDAKPEPIVERAGFKIFDMGKGYFNVVDPDGNKLNTMPLPRQIADVLLDQLAPVPVIKLSKDK